MGTRGGGWEVQIPPLRYASVGMTMGRVVLPGKVGQWRKGIAGPSIRGIEYGWKRRSPIVIPTGA
jgi:hypothetical protein